MSEPRIQHYIDPKTGERKPIRVMDISEKFATGKGGAIAYPAVAKVAIENKTDKGA